MRSTTSLAGLFAVAALSACGGGGGGGGAPAPPAPPPPPPQAQFAVSPLALTFNAAEPKAAVPAARQLTGTVTGTVTGTTLYILVSVAGSNVIDTLGAPVISGDTGNVLVTPVAPMSLGAGTFTATLTVRACMDSPTCASGELAGSPRTVNVSYSVGSSVQQDSVMPHVVDKNSSSLVVLRGSGLSGVTSVRFGTSLGTDVTVRSSTEVTVRLPPALPAGTHAVTLNSGTIAFTGSVLAVDPSAFAAAKLGYPDVPVDVPALVYDAERRALFVALRYADRSNPSNPLDHRILRYAFDGAAWGAPTVSPTTPVHVTPRLRDLALSPRGDRLLVLSEADVKEIDPVTLEFVAQGVNNDVLGTLEYMRFIALANDGYALIADDSYTGGGGGSLVLYSLATRAFTTIDVRVGSQLAGTTAVINNVGKGVVAASGDGSRVFVAAGNAHLQYTATQGFLAKTPVPAFTHSNDYRPAIDGTGAHIVIGNGTAASVFDGDYALLCTLPADTRAYAINSIGNRAFALSGSSTLQAYLTADASGGPCSPDRPEIAVDDPGIDPSGLSSVQMTISPDGAALFLAGVNHVIVQPWPPVP